MKTLFMLFVVTPIVEMWLLLEVGGAIGAIPTIGLVVLTAFIGISLLRYQGAMTVLKARMKVDAGEVPAREMADGLFFAVGGALLLTPGFVTDAIGFACLTPGIRTWVLGSISRHVLNGRAQAYSHFQAGGYHRGQGPHRQEDIIEGDFQRHDDPKHERRLD